MEKIAQTLAFSEEWFALGIITPLQLAQFAREYDTGEDPYPEHYRWRAFQEFLNRAERLDGDTARALYRLGLKDPDEALGGSMMAAVLRLKECPIGLLQEAAESDEGFLRKIAHEKMSARASNSR